MSGVVQVPATVLTNRPAGHYRQMTFAAPGVAASARPGQFVALTAGGATTAHLLRRSFSLHAVTPAGEPDPDGMVRDEDTIDLVVAAHGPGTVWLTGMRPGDQTSLVGPMGRGFPLPTEPVPCVLVGGGYGSAPLFWLAHVLRERGCPVEMVLGAASEAKVFGVEAAAAAGYPVTVTTEDGTLGEPGRVTDVLPEAIRRTQAAVVYGCGPMAMLQAVTRVAAAGGAVAQVAVEESMACAVGVCMTCVLPVRGRDGVTRMVRSCVDGPVFRGDRIRWDAFADGGCQVPADAVGATGSSTASPPLSSPHSSPYSSPRSSRYSSPPSAADRTPAGSGLPSTSRAGLPSPSGGPRPSPPGTARSGPVGAARPGPAGAAGPAPSGAARPGPTGAARPAPSGAARTSQPAPAPGATGGPRPAANSGRGAHPAEAPDTAAAPDPAGSPEGSGDRPGGRRLGRPGLWRTGPGFSGGQPRKPGGKGRREEGNR